MSRPLQLGNQNEIAKSAVVGMALADLHFPVTEGNPAGTFYVSDGFTQVSFNGNTYSPLGQFAGLKTVQEGTDMIARPIQLILSGVDSSIVGLAQTDKYQNQPLTIYVGFLDTATGLFVANPEIAWEGRMDYMEIDIDKNAGTVILNCEHRLHREPKIARYTNVDQNNFFPGDTFFDQTANIAGFKSQWGNEKQVYGGPAKGGPPFKYGGGGGGGYGGGFKV